MSADRAFDSQVQQPACGLRRVGRFPSLRALAWCGDNLYASRGYNLLRVSLQHPDLSRDVTWQTVASYRPARWRSLSAANRLSSRLFRDGFHALAVLPSSALVAAVPGAIVIRGPNETEFRLTHRVTRGTRPLHITGLPNGSVMWGEYFDNASRDEVHIYASSDAGAHWDVAHTFPRGAIRHVHNIVHDAWENCVWVLTGDYGNECRILRASCDLAQVDSALQGNQQARAVALIPAGDGIYFSSDTPLEANFIFHLDRSGNLSKRAPLGSSSLYGCQVGKYMFFSTMVEPSDCNTDREVRVYASSDGKIWSSLLSWEKDRWPMGLFQYGNAFLPDGNNTTQYLAASTVAVEADDMVTSLYSVSARTPDGFRSVI